VQASTALAQAIPEMLAHAVRHQKFGVLGPAVAPLGEAHLLLAERLAMGCAGILLVGGAVADVALDDDQGRHVFGAPKALERLRQPVGVVDVAHVRHVPAIGEETRRDIVAESQIRVPLDRHPVAVIDPAQVAEHLVTGERSRFA
jgi:hypothetical protein